jgi:hypothetical protein
VPKVQLLKEKKKKKKMNIYYPKFNEIPIECLAIQKLTSAARLQELNI